MKSIGHALMSAAAIALLAGCGGDNSTLKFVDRTNDPTFADNFQTIGVLGAGAWQAVEVADAAGNFVWFADGLKADVFQPSLPVATSATYNGSITMTQEVPTATSPGGEIYYGRMQMNADFVGDSVSGSIGDFGRANPASVGINLTTMVSGSASFSGPIINKQMTSKITGTIDGNTMGGDLAGTFFTHKDSGRNIVSGVGNVTIGTQPDAVSTFLLSQ